MTPSQAHFEMVRRGYLPMWTICDAHADRPDRFEARMHVVGNGQSYWTTAKIVGATLNEVREQLPEGVYCLGRQAADAPEIVEVWI